MIEFEGPSPIFYNSGIVKWSWLSNFYPCELSYGRTTVEHIYQALKTLNPVEQEMILKADLPQFAKAKAKRVTIRPDWMDIRVHVMETLLEEKFRCNPDLAAKLAATEDREIFHLSPWDRFWGVDNNRLGQNVEGNLMMGVRAKVIEGAL